MKQIAATLAMLAILVTLAGAEITARYYLNKPSGTFAWDYDFVANPDVMGFKLYLGTDVVTIPGQVLTHAYQDLPDGTLVAHMTAYDRYGNESMPSNQIEINKRTTPPGQVIRVRVTNANVEVLTGP